MGRAGVPGVSSAYPRPQAPAPLPQAGPAPGSTLRLAPFCHAAPQAYPCQRRPTPAPPWPWVSGPLDAHLTTPSPSLSLPNLVEDVLERQGHAAGGVLILRGGHVVHRLYHANHLLDLGTSQSEEFGIACTGGGGHPGWQPGAPVRGRLRRPFSCLPAASSQQASLPAHNWSPGGHPTPPYNPCTPPSPHPH